MDSSDVFYKNKSSSKKKWKKNKHTFTNRSNVYINDSESTFNSYNYSRKNDKNNRFQKNPKDNTINYWSQDDGRHFANNQNGKNLKNKNDYKQTHDSIKKTNHSVTRETDVSKKTSREKKKHNISQHIHFDENNLVIDMVDSDIEISYSTKTDKDVPKKKKHKKIKNQDRNLDTPSDTLSQKDDQELFYFDVTGNRNSIVKQSPTISHKYFKENENVSGCGETDHYKNKIVIESGNQSKYTFNCPSPILTMPNQHKKRRGELIKSDQSHTYASIPEDNKKTNKFKQKSYQNGEYLNSYTNLNQTFNSTDYSFSLSQTDLENMKMKIPNKQSTDSDNLANSNDPVNSRNKFIKSNSEDLDIQQLLHTSINIKSSPESSTDTNFYNNLCKSFTSNSSSSENEKLKKKKHKNHTEVIVPVNTSSNIEDITNTRNVSKSKKKIKDTYSSYNNRESNEHIKPIKKKNKTKFIEDTSSLKSNTNIHIQDEEIVTVNNKASVHRKKPKYVEESSLNKDDCVLVANDVKLERQLEDIMSNNDDERLHKKKRKKIKIENSSNQSLNDFTENNYLQDSVNKAKSKKRKHSEYTKVQLSDEASPSPKKKHRSSDSEKEMEYFNKSNPHEENTFDDVYPPSNTLHRRSSSSSSDDINSSYETKVSSPNKWKFKVKLRNSSPNELNDELKNSSTSSNDSNNIEDLPQIITEDESHQLSLLQICFPFTTIPKLHDIKRPSKPMKTELEAAKLLNVKMGPFSKEEDEQIKQNWESFCKTHDLTLRPLAFFKLPKNLKKFEKIKFLQYLSHGLDNRLPSYVHMRFKRLYQSTCLKSGRFTKKEDRTIIRFLRDCNTIKPYNDLGLLLNRSSYSVERRASLIINTLNPKRIGWNIEMSERLINGIFQVTGLKEIEDLQNVSLNPDQWKELSAILDNIPPKKIHRAWLLTVHPKLFLNETGNDVKCDLIKLMVANKETDIKTLNWKRYAEHFDGMNEKKMYDIFGHMLQRVPKDYRSDLTKSLQHLLTIVNKFRRSVDGRYQYNNGKLTLLKLKNKRK